ncbi:dihydroorotase [Kineothrix alysoides]|uniref:Dihydroorotase n=1 Tax=Kineothrix alysoides TaxID=1469948 RepID=A0A4R1R6C1_9FIRM|nr:dihydroorotase [Kineothrix alysoides]TCL61111.1 dihydroorotase [Kineothrix alysoides]
MLLIKNGYVLDPKSGKEGTADILVKDERIVRLGPGIELKEDVQVIDAAGKMVAPGLVDVHVHFRDPGFTHKEDIATGSKAAAKGGFTTVVLMANTRPPVDNEETLAYVLQRGKETGIHVETCANITIGMKGQALTDMERLAEMGAVGFTDDGIPLLKEDVVKQAMDQAEKLGKPLSFHEENPAYITNNGVNAGKASEYYGIKGSDRMAEIDMVRRDIALAKGCNADISIQHISTKEAVDLVRQARKTNRHIYAEATPHHFTLTEEAVISHGSLAKMNPPLREEEDRMAIIKGLQDGTIGIIATDHAPHSPEEKGKSLTEAPSGIIGLETSLSLGVRELVEKGYLSMNELLSRMSYQPAMLYHLDAGYLEEGGPGDLIIFDKNETWTPTDYLSKSSNTPFTGESLPCRIHYTICGGKIVYSREQ